MAINTDIAWTNATWSPLRARVKANAAAIAEAKGYASLVQIAAQMVGRVGPHCERVSHGCDICYSCTNNGRGLPSNGTRLPFDRRSRDLVDCFVDEKILQWPLRWKTGRRIFVENQSDLFGEWVSDEDIDRVFAVMALCPQHTFQVLTKRPARMLAYLSENHAHEARRRVQDVIQSPGSCGINEDAMRLFDGWPLPNVWLGISCEDQKTADERIPLLLETPAAVRFVSLEPLLSAVNLSQWLRGHKSNERIRTGVSGIIGDRCILDRHVRKDLEASSFDSGKSTGDASVLEGSRPDYQGGEVRIGRISDGNVLRREEAAQGLRTPSGLDVHGQTGYPSGLAGKSQEWEAYGLSSRESGVPDSIRECDSFDPDIRQESQGAIRRSELLREGHSSSSNGDSVTSGENLSVEDRGEVQHQAEHGVGYHPSEELGTPSLDWVIVGGESGPGARPFDIAWARNTITQCRDANVAVFVKQLGAFPVDNPGTSAPCPDERIKLKDRKGGNMDEWSPELRVREFPSI